MAIPIVMIAVLALALAAFSTPAMADYNFDGYSVTTRTNGTINGTVYVDSVGYNGQTTRTLSTNVPSGTVKAAYLYTGVWCGNPTNTGWVNVTFNGNYTANGLGPINISGENDNNPNVWCSGYGKSWWYYNVTNLTNAGQTNTATTSKINGTIDGRVYGIVLVVVLEDSSLHPIQYWVNDGSYALHYATGGHPATNTHTTTFAGSVDTGNVTYAELAAVYLTGYSPQCNACTKFNDHLLNTSEITTNTFYLKTFGADSNVTAENVTSSGNNAWFTRCNDYSTCSDEQSDPFVNICNAILTLNDTADDLIVKDVDVGTPRPNNDSTVKATVKNEGSKDVGHFNVSLYVDNVLNGTVNVTAGLGAGASTTVSFTKVNESKGCYDFKVFVDSDSEISEDIETNNNLTVKGQVGYVIEVNSYGDFDDLVTESNNGLLGAGDVSHSGDTYYIKNFTGSSTIENCAGNGITIKNLNATTKFEINNSTIENCTHSGVFLNNLTNGTIKNSTVQNNTEYGIEVGLVSLDSNDPNYVNITNNTINKNYYGIELIGFNATVSNNTITNSTTYGIYLLANDTNITYNVIQNNTDYGVKLYNSYDNYIYENVFIDNNATHSGHQACDNKNSNHWNITDIGNYWSDLKNNSGFPDTYDIDCGTNIDYHPKKLYDFSTRTPGTNAWAFRFQNNSKPPTTCDVPSTEFSSTEYGYIETDNQVYQADSSETNNYAAHRFNISIDEDATNISMINVTWNGKGYNTAGDGANLSIWNFNSAAYELLQAGAITNAEVTLTGGVTSSISNYINSGNVTVLVEQNTATSGFAVSNIETDYVKVVITPGS